MTLGAALEAMPPGGRVARTGWGTRVWVVPNEQTIWLTSPVDGKRVPWLSSEEDMLAEDWQPVS